MELITEPYTSLLETKQILIFTFYTLMVTLTQSHLLNHSTTLECSLKLV